MEYRGRALAFMNDRDVPTAMARGFDSAAAQFADLDPRVYVLFVKECLSSWDQDKDGSQCLGTHLRNATQPLPLSPSEESGSAGPNTTRRRKVSKAHLKERARREQKRRDNRDEDTICPHCKSLEHTTTEFEVQERASDEGATPYRRCENPDCAAKPWKIRDNKLKTKVKVKVKAKAKEKEKEKEGKQKKKKKKKEK